MVIQVVLYHPETGNAVTELVYSYVDFWIALLGKRVPVDESSEKLGKHEVPISGEDKEHKSSRNDQIRKVLDSMVKSILDVMRHLDLSYSFEIHTTVTSSDFGGFKVSCQQCNCLSISALNIKLTAACNG